MKTTIIAPFYDGTGYSNAARHIALGLDAVGCDIVARNVKLSGQVVNPPQRIMELEGKSAKGSNVVIQILLPHMMAYHSGAKNIGMFFCETTHFSPSGWQHYLNVMDEIWVSSEQNKRAALKSGVRKPIKVVPIPCDPSVYAKTYRPLDLNIGNRFVFYHIGDWSARKNTLGLLQSYFEEFTRNDNVVLVLKCYREGKSTSESMKFIQDEILNLKKQMRKHALDVYPPVIIIPDYLPDEQLYALHQLGHCFVSLEKAAAWNIPAFDAMGFGNQVIVNEWGGQKQFIGNGYGQWVLPYTMESVQGMAHVPYDNLYTCHEEWAAPNIKEARKAMREAYSNGKIDLFERRSDWRQAWSYQERGLALKEVLNG